MHTNLFAHINCLFKRMNCTFCMHFPVWFIGCLSCSFDLHIRTLFSTCSFAGRYRQCVCVRIRAQCAHTHTHSLSEWKDHWKNASNLFMRKMVWIFIYTWNACGKTHPQTISWMDLKRTPKTEMRATNAFNVWRELLWSFFLVAFLFTVFYQACILHIDDMVRNKTGFYVCFIIGYFIWWHVY